jgi:hypothetical protein
MIFSDKWDIGAGGLRVPVAYMEYEVVGGAGVRDAMLDAN